MLKLHHAPRTRSVRILWLLEELGLPYELNRLAFDPADLQTPEYLTLHPLGQVPALEDDGLVLNESGAIAQYLLARYGQGRLEPARDTPLHARFLYWMHFAEATLMPQLVALFLHTYRLPEEARAPQAFLDYTQGRIRLMLALIERELMEHDFLLGEFTAADIMLGYDILFARMLYVPLEDFPHVKAWYERLRARPACKLAMAS